MLAPERPETGIAGPKKIVRIPLWNNILPAVSISLERVLSGEFRYRYSVDNGKEAQDPIGKFSLVVPASIANLRFSHFPPNGGTAWGSPGVHVAGGPTVAVHDVLQKPPGQYRLWFYQGDNLILSVAAKEWPISSDQKGPDRHELLATRMSPAAQS